MHCLSALRGSRLLTLTLLVTLCSYPCSAASLTDHQQASQDIKTVTTTHESKASPTAPAASETPVATTSQVPHFSVQLTGALTHVLQDAACSVPQRTQGKESRSPFPRATFGTHPSDFAYTGGYTTPLLERIITDSSFLTITVLAIAMACWLTFPYILHAVYIITSWLYAVWRNATRACSRACPTGNCPLGCPSCSPPPTCCCLRTRRTAHSDEHGPSPNGVGPLHATDLNTDQVATAGRGFTPHTPLRTATSTGFTPIPGPRTLNPIHHHSAITANYVSRMAHLTTSTVEGLARTGNVMTQANTAHPPLPSLTCNTTYIDKHRSQWYQFIKQWTLWRTQSLTDTAITLYGALLSAGFDQPSAYTLNREWASIAGYPGLLPQAILAVEHDLLLLIEQWAAPRVVPSMTLRVRARSFTTWPTTTTSDSRSEWITAFRTHLLTLLKDYDMDSIQEPLFKDTCGLVHDPPLRTAISSLLLHADPTLESATGLQPILAAFDIISLYFRSLSLQLMQNGLTNQLINDLLPPTFTGTKQRPDHSRNTESEKDSHTTTPTKGRAARKCDHPAHSTAAHTNAECSLQQSPCSKHTGSGHTNGQCNHPERPDTSSTRKAPVPTPVPSPAPAAEGGGGDNTHTSKPKEDKPKACWFCKEPGHHSDKCTKPGAEAWRAQREGPASRTRQRQANTSVVAPNSFAPASNGATPVVPVTSHGVSFTALLDTGNTVPFSIISKSIYDSIPSVLQPSIIPHDDQYSITAFDGSTPATSILGLISLPLDCLFTEQVPAVSMIPTSKAIQQTFKFVVMNGIAPTANQCILSFTDLRSDTGCYALLLRSILQPSITITFHRPLGPVIATHTMNTLGSESFEMDADTPVSTSLAAPLTAAVPAPPSDDINITQEQLLSSVELQPLINFCNSSGLPQARELLNTVISFILLNCAALFGPLLLPENDDYRLPITHFQRPPGPAITLGLSRRIKPRDQAAAQAEIEKQIKRGYFERVSRDQVIHILPLMAVPKGLDPITGQSKKGVRIVMDLRPINEQFASTKTQTAMTSASNFFDKMESCSMFSTADGTSYFNHFKLDPSTRALFGAVDTQGNFIRCTGLPQGFLHSSSICIGVTHERVIAPLMAAFASDIITRTLPAPPPVTLTHTDPLAANSSLAPKEDDDSMPALIPFSTPRNSISAYVDNHTVASRSDTGSHISPDNHPSEWLSLAEHHWQTALKPYLTYMMSSGLRISLGAGEWFSTTARAMGTMFDGQRQTLLPGRLQGVSALAPPLQKTLASVFHIRGVLQSFHKHASTPRFHQAISTFTDIIVSHQRHGKAIKDLWAPLHDAALETCKEEILSAGPIHVFNPSKHTYLQTDASLTGWGAILFQYDNDGNQCILCAFASGFTPAQSRYAVRHKELFAIIESLRKLRQLKMPHNNIFIRTDHGNLRWGMQSTDPIVSTWMFELAVAQCYLQHIPGSLNPAPDGFSRLDSATQLVHAPSGSPPLLFVSTIGTYSTPTMEELEPSTLSLAPDALSSMLAFTQNISAISAKQRTLHARVGAPLARALELQRHFTPEELSSMSSNPSFTKRQVEDGTSAAPLHVWTRGSSLIIPASCEKQKLDALHAAHDQSMHPGTQGTLSYLHPLYWPSMRADVERYVSSCPTCQVVKAPLQEGPRGEPHRNNPPAPFHTVVIDHLLMSPTSSAGHVAILTITDAFTRFSELAPVTSLDAPSTLEALLTHLFARHGYPNIIQCDNSTSFMSDVTAFCDSHGIYMRLIPAYHPAGNGKGERTHATITRKIASATIAGMSTQWHLAVPQCQMAINSTVHRVLQMSPHQALYGMPMRTGLEAAFDFMDKPQGTLSAYHNMLTSLQTHLADSNDLFSELQRDNMAKEDHSPPPTFSVGEDILLFLPLRTDKLRNPSFYYPGYTVTALDPVPHFYHVAHVRPDGTLEDAKRVPVSRMRKFDSSRTPHHGAAILLEPGMSLFKRIVSHTRTGKGDTSELTMSVEWSDGSISTAPINDLRFSAPDMLEAYARKHNIPMAVITRQARRDKLSYKQSKPSQPSPMTGGGALPPV